MAYKQNFKSPILKALVGKQKNLPQHLQDAIKAAPESPAKQTIDPPNKGAYAGKHGLKKAHVKAAKGMLDGKILPAGSTKNMTDKEILAAAEKKGVYEQAMKMAKKGRKKASPAKLTTDPPKQRKKVPTKPAPKTTPQQRREVAKKMNKVYGPESAKAMERSQRKAKAKGVEKMVKKGSEGTGKVYGPKSAEAFRKSEYKKRAKAAVKTLKKDRKPGEKVYKDSSPAKKKGPGKRGKSNKLTAGQAIGAGYVEAGTRDTRSERKELKKQLAGASSNAEKTKINKKLRMAERSQRNYDVNKRRNQSIDKRAKVLDEAGSKSDLVRADNLRSQKRPDSKGIGTYKTVTDVKVKRRPKISEMNSPAKKKKPSSGLDGYTKIASSKSSNVIAAKKAAASRKNPKSAYKFTKNKKTGETHLYQKK